MANFHFEVKVISRGKGRSLTKAVNYISGCRLYDSYKSKIYYKLRHDVLYCKVFQPPNAPPGFCELQHICNEIERAEKRYDARTAREFIGSLPNELSEKELENIVYEFVYGNFIQYGLCAIVAIHMGNNKDTPSRNNPHVHIIVPTRTVGPDGFNKKKSREWDNKKYVAIWREDWAAVQNRAYERNGFDIRVSHESLEVQGLKREPTIHLSRIDWQKEARGEHTIAGDKRRDIITRNAERIRKRSLEQEHRLNIELSH